MMASINSIESFGTVDGPGIRTVVFFNGCNLRCIYCHNPETWVRGDDNMEVSELFNKIIRNKEYFGDTGGVTFSGGEPLLHIEFLIPLCKMLKEKNINIALDTAGVGLGNYDELLNYVDLVILDIKHVDSEGYRKITRRNLDEVQNFINACNRNNKKMWLRQVVVPGITDTDDYIVKLNNYIKKINNIEKIEFLPYHKLGEEKYKRMGIPYACDKIPPMDKDACDKLYQRFMNLYDANKEL